MKTYGIMLKAVPESKFLALSAYIRKKEKSKINELRFHIKNL